MRYVSALIAVRDIKKAREFYEGLFGLAVTEDYGENVAYSCGLGLQEGFAKFLNLPEPSYSREGFELYFEEDELDEFAARLPEYGAKLLQAVYEQPWGQRCVRFYDLDSHIIEVGESMAAAVRRFVSQGLSDEEIAAKTLQPLAFVRECRELVDARR